MKKLLLCTSLVANLVFLLMACQKESVAEKGKGRAQTSLQPDRDGTVIATGSSSCQGDAPSMPYNLVRDLILNYQTRQQRAIEQSLGFNDASACWFDLAAMKNYICQLEEKVEQGACGNLGALGLRFYYAAHTPNPAAYGSPDEYANLHNLIIIPTYRNSAGMDVSFDPDLIDITTCLPVGLNLPKNGTGGGQPPAGSNGNIFSLNHGQLGPPGPL
jgi:hypothetical protein